MRSCINNYRHSESLPIWGDLEGYHGDHIGSTSWVSDEDNMPVQFFRYLPFGENHINQRLGEFDARYTFSGKEKDQETGFSYFGARYYDSDLSIWLSVDPLAHVSPHLSPYVYCSNNPLNKIDPLGLTDYEVNGQKKNIDDGVNNLKIGVNQRQFNRLERKFNNGNGYEKYRDKMSVKNGYTTTSSSGSTSTSESGVTTLPTLDATFHAPGGQSYSDWSNSNSLGTWSEGMPTDATINGQTYVVPTNSDSYVNINSNGLLDQFKNQLHEQGKSYRGHPLDIQLSGEFWMWGDVWGRLNVPFTIPDPRPNNDVKTKANQRNAQNRMNHYRKAGVIR